MASNNKVLRGLNYINGKFVDSIDGQRIDDINPATNQIIATIPRSTKADVEQAVKAAEAAFQSWKDVPATRRAQYLDAIADKLEKNLKYVAQLESNDTGKPLGLASTLDVPRAISNFRFFAGQIRHDETSCHEMADAINFSMRSPVGVAGLITPWNLPIYLLSWKIAPALACGNTIVAKPSELTPMSADALARIIHEVGLPPGVFNLVHGYGHEAGQAIIEHKNVRLISFTGGTVTGAKVARAASSMFKKVSLELGGKNSTIVFADCDLEATVDGAARAAFANQGQVCLAGSRIFVEHSIYNKFLELLVQKVQTYVPGDPRTSNFGSVISLDHRKKIESYVAIALKEGGHIACGGKRPDLPAPFSNGAFYEPTIIAGLSPASRCSQEEIFGPVCTIHPFKTEDEVIRAVNSVRYGLAGSLWTNNLPRAHRVTKAIHTGMIWVNCWLHRDLRVPFGGVKDSGIGREGGRHSLEFYSELKNVCFKYSKL